MIALLFFCMELYVKCTGDFYFDFLKLWFSLLSAKKIHCSDSKIFYVTQLYLRSPQYLRYCTASKSCTFNISLYVNPNTSGNCFNALCCTYSIMFIRFFRKSFQTVISYSICSLTIDTNNDNKNFFFEIYKRSWYYTS